MAEYLLSRHHTCIGTSTFRTDFQITDRINIKLEKIGLFCSLENQVSEIRVD